MLESAMVGLTALEVLALCDRLGVHRVDRDGDIGATIRAASAAIDLSGKSEEALSQLGAEKVSSIRGCTYAARVPR